MVLRGAGIAGSEGGLLSTVFSFATDTFIEYAIQSLHEEMAVENKFVESRERARATVPHGSQLHTVND